jgi:hypothetical protein
MRPEGLTVVLLRTEVFWDVTLFSWRSYFPRTEQSQFIFVNKQFQTKAQKYSVISHKT